MDIKRNIYLIVVICLMMHLPVAYAQVEDNKKVTLPQSVSKTTNIPKQPTVIKQPSLPKIPKLPVIPKTVTTPTLPKVSQQTDTVDRINKMQATIINGEYIGLEQNESGEIIIVVKSVTGEEMRFFLSQDARIGKGDNAISIDEVMMGDSVVIDYIIEKNENGEDERIITSLFVMTKETSSLDTKIQQEEAAGSETYENRQSDEPIVLDEGISTQDREEAENNSILEE
ncbi:MAG: hypothetical protein V1893_03515 [Candidatus Omnitrophota bacterium]